MIYRWWEEWQKEREDLAKNITAQASAVPVLTGENTFIASDAQLSGNIIIGNNCMIGTGVILRGDVIIQDNVRLGYGVEVKDSIIRANVTVGPLCYLGDSLVEAGVYMGALVRTSNHRLDRGIIKSWNGQFYEATGCEKLGAHIKENTSLGVGVVILPGRIIPANSSFEPHIVIKSNYPPGHYKLEQTITRKVAAKNDETPI